MAVGSVSVLNAPAVSVVEDLPSCPRLTALGPGVFTDLFSSPSSSKAPIVCGIWNADDCQEGTESSRCEVDEMKYVISGESIWEDVRTGKCFNANAGSMIWLPKGADVRLVSSKNLVTVYCEQDSREPVSHHQLRYDSMSRLDDLYAEVLQQYVDKNPKSEAQHHKALKFLPGGNTRSVLHYAPFPLTFSSGHECHVTSIDGTQYLDCVSEYSAALFGHSHPDILAAVESACQKGLNLGGNNSDEVELAEQIVNRIPSIDKVRFTNSGTEANIMAMGLALEYTGRKKILAFSNGYHGAFTHFGSKVKALNLPYDFVLGKFNDIDFSRALVTEDIGCIIVEPMQGAGGMHMATKAFLTFLRESATRIGAILVFDEIITSRLNIGGLQSYFEVYPDLTTLGKYIGGGFAFGACGGRSDIMAALNPGQFFHSGTYNNNTVSMAAGVAAGRIVSAGKIDKANNLGDKIRNGINSIAHRTKWPFITSTGFGSCVGVHFGGPCPTRLKDTFFFYLLSKGIYIGKRGFLSLNLTHEEEHVDYILKVVEEFVQLLLS